MGGSSPILGGAFELFHQLLCKDVTVAVKMYGAANYYLPAKQEDDKTSPFKKTKHYESVSTPPRAVRILGRRYALTTTAFKYLEIGINVGFESVVEVIIGDNRGVQILLPTATRKTLIEKRSDIQRLLDESSSPVWVRDLTVEVCTIANSKMFKVMSLNNYLYLKPATMENLFNLEHCVEHMYQWLTQNTYIVNTKYQKFINVLQQKSITEICNASQAIRESEMFDCNSLIDCELLACSLKNIMYDSLEK